MENWDDLRFFLAIAREGTLSGAARSLKVDAATVHRRLASLEARLSARLFDRLAKGFVPTAVGAELVRATERIDEEIAAAERALYGRDDNPAGKVCLTTVDIYVGRPVGRALARLRREHPEIDLEVIATPRLLSLSRREADLALRPGKAPSDPNIVGTYICDVAIGVYGHRDYLEEYGIPTSYADLDSHVIITGDDTLAHVSFVRYIREQAPKARIALRGDSVLLQMNAAKAGLGLTALPCFLANDDPELVRVLPPTRETAVELWLLTHVDVQQSARVRVVAEHLQSALKEQRGLLEDRENGN